MRRNYLWVLGATGVLVACGGDGSGPVEQGKTYQFTGSVRDTLLEATPDSITVRVDGQRVTLTNGTFVAEVDSAVEFEVSVTVTGYLGVTRRYTMDRDTSVTFNPGRTRPAIFDMAYGSTFARAFIFVPAGFDNLSLGDSTTTRVSYVAGTDTILTLSDDWDIAKATPEVGQIVIQEAFSSSRWTLVDVHGNRATFSCTPECVEE